MRPRARLRAQFGAPSVDKALGALPVVADFCRRLDVAGIVDRACPVRDKVALVTHGQVIEALVANRLSSPTPLVHVQDWAAEWAVEEVWGIDPATLNDDRVGRALDAVAPALDHLVGTVGARAVATFGLDVARLHWDLTSISLYGAYDDPDADYPEPRYGHPKDRRPDLKQVQTGLAVSGDGGVPVFHRAYDGGAGEVAQVVGAMTALKQLARQRRFLLVGDSKLVSYPNLAAMIAAEVDFIAPASKTYVPAHVLAAHDPDAATPVDYVAARDQGKPPERRGSYRVTEDTMTLAGKAKRDPTLAMRRVFVWSSANAQAAATNRARKLERARGDLDRLSRGLGSRHYPDPEAVTARVRQITAKRKLTGVLRAEVGVDQTTGKPTLAWSFDQARVDAEAATDGWYALLTNLTPAQADAAEILARYKGQEAVERRYGSFKGPLAVAPLFLKSNRRIAALITVICLVVDSETLDNLVPLFVITTIIGFVAIGPWLCMLAGRGMARVSRRVPGLLAARRIAGDPRATFRAVSGVVLAAFSVTFSASLVDLSGDRAYDGGAGVLRPGVVEIFTGGVPEAQVAPLLSEQAVVTRFEIGAAGALVESCPELARVVTLSCSSSGLAEGIYARAGLADADLPILSVYVLTDGTPAAENRVRTQAANLVPNAIIHTQQDRVDVDALYIGNLGQLLRVGWLFVLVVAACSLTVGMVAGVIERRRPFALLRASGLRLGELRQVVFLETAAAMLVTAAVGVGLGLGSSYALALFGDMAWMWPDVGVFAMVGIGVLAALLLSTMALPLLDAATRLDAVRYE